VGAPRIAVSWLADILGRFGGCAEFAIGLIDMKVGHNHHQASDVPLDTALHSLRPPFGVILAYPGSIFSEYPPDILHRGVPIAWGLSPI